MFVGVVILLLCGVDNGVPQLPQKLSENFDNTISSKTVKAWITYHIQTAALKQQQLGQTLTHVGNGAIKLCVLNTDMWIDL